MILLSCYPGFSIYYKKDHEKWTSMNVSASNRSHTAAGLLCGTKYRFFIYAMNKLGKSANSDTVIVSTNGSSK